MVTLNDFKIVNSLMELFEALLVNVPESDVLAIMSEIAVLQGINLLLNPASFLTNQIVLRRLIIAAIMTILHCGDQA